jgi:hypothetical protein
VTMATTMTTVATTAITVVTVDISPPVQDKDSNGFPDSRDPHRAWVLRTHLLPGQRVQAVVVDGASVDLGAARAAAGVEVVNLSPDLPSSSSSATPTLASGPTAVDSAAGAGFPFKGAGSRPMPQAGVINEIRVELREHRRNIKLHVAGSGL